MNKNSLKNLSAGSCLTPIAAGVGLMVFCASLAAQTATEPAPALAPAAAPLQVAQAAADSASAEPKKADRSADPEIQKVVVKGLRASLQESLNQKRRSDTMVEVITAEDIGKLPDKNVADAVQRLPGVNTSSSSSGEGGFDENDRVSIRGTSASLTQTLINGHAVGSGDWFILSQFGSVGRSVSFTLLPSELVGSVVVHKSASAELVEGGVSGAINIVTRKPLEFKKQVTAEASLGGVYADKPKKTDPQFNALLNFKNDENTFGALFQVFSEKRSSRRDGQELLGYHAISPTSAAAVAHPDLANVLVPNFIGSALFEQVRERTGGTIALQFKPSKELTLGVDAFYSKLVATNSNINSLANTGAIGDQIPASYTVRNNTLVSATVPASAGYTGVITDAIYRPGEGAKSSFLNVDLRYRATKDFTITAQAGVTKGEGFTPSQPAYESNANNVGVSYNLNGTASPAGVNLSRTAFSPGNSSTGWAWDNKLFTNDKEKYAQADGELVIDKGVFDTIKFGVRWADHHRKVDFPLNGGCLPSPLCGGNPLLPAYGGRTYPSDFGSGLGGSLPGGYIFDIDAIRAYNAVNANFNETQRHNWTAELDVQETNKAAYVMANLLGTDWSGNAGLRFVTVNQNSIVGFNGGPIKGSLFGDYRLASIKHTYNDVLPSANIKYKLSPELVLRAAAARVLARPDYSALGGSVSLNDLTLSGNGGNPDLKPIRSNNLDVSLEWYFAPKSLLSVGLFNQQYSSFVSNSVHGQSFYDQLRNKQSIYQVVSPVNVGARNRGMEVSYQQPIGAGFGALVNYTYADGKEDGGGPMVGSSKNSYNLEGYYEQGPLSVRLAYSHRSDFLVGLDRSFKQYQKASGSLAASINYTINDRFTVGFDALNLTNETLKYYGENQDQPRAFYSNGRQFYLTLRGKL